MKPKVIFIFLICLNLILGFLYKSLPFPLPQISTLALDSDTLIHYTTENLIKPGLQNGPILMNPEGVVYTPDQDLDEWTQNNRVYLIPSLGKIRCEAQIFSLHTRNPFLFAEGKLIFDTLFPGSGPFGFGVIDSLQEHLFFKESSFYYWKGPRLIEVFREDKSKGEWIPLLNPGFHLSPKESVVTLRDKCGVSKAFQESTTEKEHYILSRTFDSFGNELSYRFNEKNQLMAIDNAGENPLEIFWNSSNLVQSIKTEKGQFNFAYDTLGNLITLKIPSGQTLELKHNSPTYPHKITGIKMLDDLNFQFKYTLAGKISEIKSPRHFITLAYGKNMIAMTFKDNKAWLENTDSSHFNYKINETQLRMNFDLRGRPVEFEKSGGQPMQFKYDNKDNLIYKKVGPDVFEYQYDDSSNILYKIKCNNEIVSEKSIENGLVVSEMKKDLGELRFSYDDFGNIISMKVGEESPISFKRDALGLITEVAGLTGPLSEFHWKNQKLVNWKGDFGTTFKFNYNEMGEWIEILHPNGFSLFNSYRFHEKNPYLSKPSAFPLKMNRQRDANGKIQIQNHLGQEFTAELDSLRHITQLNFNNQEISYTYDKDNSLKQVSWGPNRDVSLHTNSQGLIQSYLGSDGSYCNLQYTHSSGNSNKVSNLVASTEGEKDIRSYGYDKRGRLTQMTVNTIFKYKFEYGPSLDNSLIYDIQYPDGNKTSYTYSSKGKLESVTFRNTKPIQFRYDGSTEEIAFPNGVKETKEYDSDSNTQRSMTLVGTDGQALRECAYYFKNGKWVSGLDQGRKLSLSYDSENRIKEFSAQSLDTLQYSFNGYGNPIEIARTGKSTIKFEYNPQNNSMALIDSSKQTPISTINVFGSMIGSKLNFIEIDGVSQIVEDSSAFQFNNMAIVPGTNALKIKWVLTSGTSFGQSLHFNVHPQAYAVYEFNANGSLHYQHQDAQSQEFVWTHFNQLKTYHGANGEVFEYRYLPNGNRASLTVFSKQLLFVYDIFGNLIEELSPTGTSVMKYVYDYQSNRLLLGFDGKNTYYYHTDSFGSVINITNSEGKTCAEYLYSPYGQTLYKKETFTENKRGFLGFVKDQETGCYLTPQGYYDPATLLLNKSKYVSPFHSEKYLDLEQYLLPRKAEVQALDNSSLKPLEIPFDLSFEKDFFWVDLLPNIHPDIANLKKYLTTSLSSNPMKTNQEIQKN